jgi:hypothetical protein
MKTFWRLAIFYGVLLVIAGIVYLAWSVATARLTTSDYAAMASRLEDIALVLVWVGAVFQTGFVLTWATLPWYREWIGRALMIKSLSLAILFDSAIIQHYIGPYPAQQLVGVLLTILVVLAIVLQFAALVWEMWRAGDIRLRTNQTLDED